MFNLCQKIATAHKQRASFTLLEVLLASIIFIMSVAGVFVTLNAVRGPVANKENQLAATVFGKRVLEALYSQVDNATYYSSCSSPCPNFDLSVGSHQVPPANLPTGLTWPTALTSSPCSAIPILSYTVSCADGSSPCGPNVARRVDLNIKWPNVQTGTC